MASGLHQTAGHASQRKVIGHGEDRTFLANGVTHERQSFFAFVAPGKATLEDFAGFTDPHTDGESVETLRLLP